MNTKTLGLLIVFSLLFTGCATRLQIPVDLSDPKVKAAYDKENRKISKEIKSMEICEARNAARVDRGLPPRYVCRRWGYRYYYPHIYYNVHLHNRYMYYRFPRYGYRDYR